ncbi:MAG: hypothetical protein A2161_10440 [Candidatus Schekmanbacteria bacterium RBG_13_48_7]|uniref:Calcineurin-like phosphoesterase domain-containing protein n=1 Tax=Candidatus Schekmanbacteria bacterium RBG_13_48_7 TaxID=1817878 RepID=A0A1F7RZR1_9BACT|nr:MAG: hypothetical protein A2161_10440 [Candidatus Schekmanbacteria bacterium RBG_13_48_7]
MSINFIHLADTHLGAEYTVRPRTLKERRGKDFFHNYELALQPAFDGNINFVIHSGDLFNRSKPPLDVITKAYEPLINVAQHGLPVFLIPGNHERSFFPRGLLLSHPNIHVFYQPETVVFRENDYLIAITGIPFVRKNARDVFRNYLKLSCWKTKIADIRILLVHQIFDNAIVGPHGYVFRKGEEVISRKDIPPDFDYVAAGHVHPHQYLENPFNKNQKICYSGSIDRISFAEINEDKGYIKGTIDGNSISTKFFKLPVKQMLLFTWNVNELDSRSLQSKMEKVFQDLNPMSICRIKLIGSEKYLKFAKQEAHKFVSCMPNTAIIQIYSSNGQFNKYNSE